MWKSTIVRCVTFTVAYTVTITVMSQWHFTSDKKHQIRILGKSIFLIPVKRYSQQVLGVSSLYNANSPWLSQWLLQWLSQWLSLYTLQWFFITYILFIIYKYYIFSFLCFFLFSFVTLQWASQNPLEKYFLQIAIFVLTQHTIVRYTSSIKKNKHTNGKEETKWKNIKSISE